MATVLHRPSSSVCLTYTKISSTHTPRRSSRLRDPIRFRLFFNIKYILFIHLTIIELTIATLFVCDDSIDLLTASIIAVSIPRVVIPPPNSYAVSIRRVDTIVEHDDRDVCNRNKLINSFLRSNEKYPYMYGLRQLLITANT